MWFPRKVNKKENNNVAYNLKLPDKPVRKNIDPFWFKSIFMLLFTKLSASQSIRIRNVRAQKKLSALAGSFSIILKRFNHLICG